MALGSVSVLARGSLVAPAAAAGPAAEQSPGTRSAAGSSPGSEPGLELPRPAVAAGKAAAWPGEPSRGRWPAAVAPAAAAEGCAGWRRSALGGLWMGRTAAGSASAPSAARPEEWEAFHLQSKRKHSADHIKTSDASY